MKTIRCLLCLSAGSLVLAAATATVAQQSYPSRPVRFVVSWSPGGAMDLIARVVGPKLGEQLGQQVVIDNRAGASGAIGTDLVAKSAPDGHTLLVGAVSELVLNPMIVKVPYDPVRDFTAVSPLALEYYLLAVHPSLPARSVKDLIALAKARPGEINYASGGTGSNLALVAELFKSIAGINMTHIPYKGGFPARQAVSSGESQAMFASVSSTLPFVNSNRLVPLAVTSPKRSPLLPKVPTFAESGLRGMDATSWYGLLAPAATPREIIARLNAEIVKLGATPDYRAQLEKLGYEPFTSSPEKFSAFMKTELAIWGKVIKAAGIKPD
ncbi:MAG: tripartite tricarboxylate transporter substrate binding protein [Betaproteobacteria bacterium]|nr:tripartite tricarboxylate transporter substrate binding protein [Betaproteobacteria bacterium]